MAIEPIGLGFSGMEFGSFGGSSGGMNVYRRSSPNMNYGQKGFDGNVLPSLNGSSVPETGANGKVGFDSGIGMDGRGDPRNGKISAEADRKRCFDSFECQTCKNRKYQDGSDDMGVSFQTPTRVDPRAAASKVRSHEQEHVTRNQAKARREGNEIVAQSVAIHTGICPECGKVYVSGGTTTTITKSGKNNADKYSVGMFDPSSGRGEALDKIA